MLSVVIIFAYSVKVYNYNTGQQKNKRSLHRDGQFQPKYWGNNNHMRIVYGTVKEDNKITMGSFGIKLFVYSVFCQSTFLNSKFFLTKLAHLTKLKEKFLFSMKMRAK